MAQIRNAPFHGVGLALIQDRGVVRVTIHQGGLGREAITVVRRGVRRSIHHGVQAGFGPCFHDRPADITVRRAVQARYDVDFFFLVLTKVYSSSSSTVSTWAGTGGASGIWAAAALTQFMTV